MSCDGIKTLSYGGKGDELHYSEALSLTPTGGSTLLPHGAQRRQLLGFDQRLLAENNHALRRRIESIQHRRGKVRIGDLMIFSQISLDDRPHRLLGEIRSMFHEAVDPGQRPAAQLVIKHRRENIYVIAQGGVVLTDDRDDGFAEFIAPPGNRKNAKQLVGTLGNFLFGEFDKISNHAAFVF